jgi:hypothetical protein
MDNTLNLFGDRRKLAGHIETDSGSILLTDGVWETALPQNSQERLALDLGVEQSKIPVYGILLQEKRYLLIALDEAISTHVETENVETEGKVDVEEEKEEEGEDRDE